MTLKDLKDYLLKKGDKIEYLTRIRMPVIAGAMAVSHFKNNFRQGGFVNNGLQPWQKAKRLEGNNKGAHNDYKTLTRERNHLMSSTSYIPADSAVLIKNDVPYASIHNEGGQVVSDVKDTNFESYSQRVLYSEYRGLGYAQHKTHPYTDLTGAIKTRQHLYWTQKGFELIYNLFKKKLGLDMLAGK